MDFIAAGTSLWRLQRHLSGETDDFVAISDGSSTTYPTLTKTYSPLDVTLQETINILDGEKARPLFSPSAEAELFLLATNFLLCKLERRLRLCIVIIVP
jgi:hypothetical protein